MAWHGMAWHGMPWHAIAWHCILLHGRFCVSNSLVNRNIAINMFIAAPSQPVEVVLQHEFRTKECRKQGVKRRAARPSTCSCGQMNGASWLHLMPSAGACYTKTQMVAGPTMGTFCQLQNQSYLTKISEKDPRVTPNETNSDTKVTPH